MKKKILLGLGSVSAIAILLGLTIALDGPVNLRNTATDVTISSVELYNDFALDEESSNTKYLDKVIEIEGKVVEISKDESGNVNVYLATDEDAIGQVSCSFTSKNGKQALKLSKGSIVKLKGQCSGYLFDVVINNCIIIS